MASNKKEYSLGFIIGAQLKSSFPKAFKNVEKHLASAKKAVKDCGQAWKNFGASAAKLVAGISAAAVAAGTVVFKAVDDIAVAGDRAAKNAAKLKLSTEAYQELEYAFSHAGVGADQFYDAMRTLEGKLTEVAFNEEEAKRWAEEFGLSAEKLKNMSPEKRIERLSDYFNALEDPIMKDKLAMEMFGESGIALTAALSMGSKGIQDLRKEAVQTGNVMTNEVAKQAEAYGDAKDRMQKTFNGIKVQLFQGLLPVFTGVFGQISDKLQSVDWAAWGDKITGWVQGAIPKIQEIAIAIGDFIARIWQGIQAVKDFVGGWGNLGKIILIIISLRTAILGVIAVVKTLTMVGQLIGMLASPVGLVIAAVAALAAGVFLVIKNWEAIRAWWTNLWANITQGARAFVDNVLRIFAPIVDFFKGIGSWISNLFGGEKTMKVNVAASGGNVPGHAAGGIFNRPHIARIAEGGDPEAVMPINDKPASRNIWETAGRMAGFTAGDDSGSTSTTGSAARSASDLAGRMAGGMPHGGSDPISVSVPVNITITGNADAGTVGKLKSAASDIGAQVRTAVRDELDAIARQKARLAY